MAIPDYQSLMLPVLQTLADRDEVSIAETREQVAARLKLSDEDLAERPPRGRQSTFINRTSWAVAYLSMAGLVGKPRRGVYRLTEDGERLLANAPDRIDNRLLERYPAFVKKRKGTDGSSNGDTKPQPMQETELTPEERMDHDHKVLERGLEVEVLDRVRNSSPAFFEGVVKDLLIAMGYGGGRPEMGEVVGRPGDGGIDGTIREDALGLDEVYVQAKRYAEGNTVGEGELRNFAGALDAAGTVKGVYVTTSTFTSRAWDYITRSPKRIVLIDGEELARLLMRHDVGVRTKSSYHIKRIDEDYFNPEDI